MTRLILDLVKHQVIWLAHKSFTHQMEREATKPHLINKTWLICKIFRNNRLKVLTMEFYKLIWALLIEIIKNKILINPLKICNNQT